MVPATATPAARLMPTINADGVPVVPMSDEQKYLFDLKGWIRCPACSTSSSSSRSAPTRFGFSTSPRRCPRSSATTTRPSQVLLDAPAVVAC